MEDREQALEKIQKLLAKAESTTFGPERDAFLDKVNEMMLRFAVEEEEIRMARNANMREAPIVMPPFRVVGAHNVIWQPMVTLTTAVFRHLRCQPVYYGLRNQGATAIEVTAVGFKSDLEFAKLLTTSLHIQLASSVDPPVDPTLSEAENAYRMRMAGIKWERIYEKFCEAHFPGYPYPTPFPIVRSMLMKYTPMVKRYAEEHGLPRNMQAGQTNYQLNFAEGFVYKIIDRFYEMDQANRSTALVLASRTEEVAAKLQEAFPDMKSIVTMGSTKANRLASAMGQAAGNKADLSGGRSAGGGPRKAINQ